MQKTNKWTCCVRSLIIFGLLFGCTLPNVFSSERAPNVVFILADDLGWSDTSLFNTSKFYQTPNIQRLAKRGMTFTRAYSASPLCSPTRASILTGLSPARTGITAPNCHLPQVVLNATVGARAGANEKSIAPNTVTRLKTEYFTLAEALKEKGYATGHFGKWHLGAEPYSPRQQGFDVDVPHWPGPGPAGSYVAPWKFPDFDPDTPNEHIEDRMASEAEKFMERNKEVPFFLNYWMFSVHAPFNAKQDLVKSYKKKVDENNPQRSPTYAAMIESMDDAVGKLLDTLDRLKIADNTIIVFTSDNGGNMYNEIDNTTATSNAPLRGGKATLYEGGVRVPAVVVYPKLVAANSQSNEIIQSCDYYPTLLDLLSISHQPHQTFDGVSIRPALMGERLDRNAIFTYFPHSPNVPEWLPPAITMHQGDWKLIRIFHGGELGKHRWKLFNLSEDIGEQNDRANERPDLVTEMDRSIEMFLNDTHAVKPIANPGFDLKQYRPELEGKGVLKGKAAAIAKPKTKRKSTKEMGEEPQSHGWTSSPDCTVSVDGKSIKIVSNGEDPYIVFRLPNAIPSQKLTLQFNAMSNASGTAQVFWQEIGVDPSFHRERSSTFEFHHDEKVHEYAISIFPKNSMIAIRIDPARASGEITLSNICLLGNDGVIISSETFETTR